MKQSSPRRGGRPALLTPERVVIAAVEVLDAEGLDALTMRGVGARLGVAAMSLYRHVPNRAALLAGVVNHLFAESLVELRPDDSWPQALTRFAEAYRRMLLAHPHAVPLLATHPVDVDSGLSLLADLLERFSAAGVERVAALTVVQSVGVYVLGHALAQVGRPPGAPETEPSPEATAYYDRWFEVGLHAMVSGFEHDLGAGRAR